MQEHRQRDPGYNSHHRGYMGRAPLQIPTTIVEANARSTTPIGLYGAGTFSLPSIFPTANTDSASPDERHALSSEYPYRAAPRAMPPHSEVLSQVMNSNPKRAYRQRRKDPSCDACRERKVKCDATETTSCTECSSRNVRCQFTKDTNRRMSSIKQVQDLERQLYEVRAQLERVRASEFYTDEGTNSLPLEANISEVSRSPRRMLKARSPYDLNTARVLLSDVGRGILKPAIAPYSPSNPEYRDVPSSDLPSRELSQCCLDAYLQCVHRHYPILLWTQFCSDLWLLYEPESSLQIAREKVSLCFTVLGVGALFSPETQVNVLSEQLVRLAMRDLDFCTDQIGIDQCLAIFLTSLYFKEINKMSSSLTWLASAIRIAQDRGLHIQGGNWSPEEGELRKRIWYSLYTCDRLMAIESGRPMIILDDDCDTEYPEMLEEEYNLPDKFHPQLPTVLLMNTHVARLLAPLAKLFRSLCITSEATNKFEAYLSGCMQLFPLELQLQSDTPLDPLTSAPMFYFQNTRLLLYRHNMSPACSQEQRSVSIKKCTLVAEDTANVVGRCFPEGATQKDIETRIRASATRIICTHIWRCLLFLAFSNRWKAFYKTVRFAAIVGDTKDINVSCGRHLALFLQRLIQRQQSPDEGDAEEDEDLIVLLSGDLQGGTGSWVWGNTETGTLLSRRQKHSRTGMGDTEPPSTPGPGVQLPWGSMLSEEEQQQWGGWQRIYELARWLEQAQEQRQSPSSSAQERQSQMLGSFPRSISRADSDRSSSNTRSRMTIASITDL